MLENSFILFLLYLDFGQISVTIIRYIINVLKKYFKSIPHHLKAFSYSYPVPQGTGPPSEAKELVSVPIRGSAFRLICRAFSNAFFYCNCTFSLFLSFRFAFLFCAFFCTTCIQNNACFSHLFLIGLPDHILTHSRKSHIYSGVAILHCTF